MSTEQRLITDLAFTIDGEPAPITSSSGRLTSWLGFQREPSPSTVGPHAYTETKKVPEGQADIQLTEGYDIGQLKGMNGVPIAATQGTKRILMQDCSIKDAQEIGNGAVTIMWMVMGEIVGL